MQSRDIRDYWDRKARELGTNPSATMKDVILRSMEIEAISERLASTHAVLDVGAGNAFGSLVLAEHCRSMLATDYSQQMVEAARQAIADARRSNIRADRADILDLANSQLGLFDVVTCVRCLINLDDYELQHRAVNQMGQVLGPGGRLLLIEGVRENFEALNELRCKVRLHPIKLNWHNTLPARQHLESWLGESFDIEETVDFGEYYFVSRVLHPLLVAPEEPRFDSPVNQIAKSIWRSGGLRGQFAGVSTLLMFCCRKR